MTADGNGDADYSALVERLRVVALEAARRGASLPGEPTLALELGVSRPSLREALVRLETEGLIRRRKGADTIVNPGAAEIVARFDQQAEYAGVLRDAGFTATVELLEHSVVSLAAADARRLGTGPGHPALRTVKRWRADERPVMVAVDLIPAPRGDAARLATVDADEGLFAIVARLTGDVVEWELAWPGAEVARAAVRRWLDTTRRHAVLTLDLVGITRRGFRAYHAVEYHVPGAVPSGFIRSVRG